MRVAAVIALLAPGAAWAAAGSPIPLEARPGSTRIGGATVAITFEAPYADPSDLRCVSSVGRTSGPSAAGSGKFVCRLKPPARGPNQVAVVVVYSVKMNGPIGATFVNINGRGDADYPRAVLFARPAIVSADGTSTAEINLFALDRSGQPFGAEFSHVTASAGQVGPLRAAGVGRAVATFTAPTSGDGVDIEARLPDGGGKVNAQFRITLTAAAPALVSMVGPRRVVNPGDPVTISVSLSSEGGGPASGTLKLRTDTGRAILPVEDGPGLYTATFSIPSDMAPGGSVTVNATVNPMPGVPGKTLQASLKIPIGQQPGSEEFVAAPAAPPVKTAPKGPLHAVFEAGLTARKQHTKRITFTLQDQDGDAWTPDDVVASVDVGQIKGVARDGKRFVADYEAPDTAGNEAQIKVAVGGKEIDGSGYVVIQARGRGPDALGLTTSLLLGGMTNFGSVTAPDFELVAMYSIRAVKGLRVGGFVGLSPTGAQVSPGCPQSASVPAASYTGKPGCPAQSGVPFVTTGTAQQPVSIRGTPVALRADWGVPFGEADVYIGGSLGLMLVSGTANGTGGAPNNFLAPAFYKAVYGGIAYPLGPGSINGEVRWSDARFDGGTSQVEVTGNFGGPTALVGYQMEF